MDDEKLRDRVRRARYEVDGARLNTVATWLFSFIKTDLAQISGDDWRNLSDEIHMLAGPEWPGRPVEPWRLAHVLQRTQVVRLQAELRNAVQTLFGAEMAHWQFPIATVRRVILRNEELMGGAYVSARLRDRFLMKAADALEEVGGDVRSCARCSAQFVRVKGKTHCSAACSQRKRTDKYRSNPSNRERINASRRARYRRTLERARGGPVRVQIRTKKMA